MLIIMYYHLCYFNRNAFTCEIESPCHILIQLSINLLVYYNLCQNEIIIECGSFAVNPPIVSTGQFSYFASYKTHVITKLLAFACCIINSRQHKSDSESSSGGGGGRVVST